MLEVGFPFEKRENLINDVVRIFIYYYFDKRKGKKKLFFLYTNLPFQVTADKFYCVFLRFTICTTRYFFLFCCFV